MAQRSRVLVVEDEETLRDTIADLMQDDGHEVRVAADGVDALAQTDGWQPDLVILDVMLPRMDAFEFRKRQLAAGHVAKILLVSAAPGLSTALPDAYPYACAAQDPFAARTTHRACF